MRAPRLLATGTAAASLLLLTGCEKPSPIVSVVSGGDFVSSEAVRWCFDGQDPSLEPGVDGACSVEERVPEVVEVQPGELVGIDVAKEVSDEAWVVVIRPQAGGDGGEQPQEQASGVQDEHYFSFRPSFQDGPLEVQVRSLASEDPGATQTGFWSFVLVPQD